MNERLKELYNQAREEVSNRDGILSPGALRDKFAELIVQECILVIEENAEHIHAEGTIEAIVNLEKYFGVD